MGFHGFDAGFAQPIAVHGRAGGEAGEFGQGFVEGGLTVEHGAVQFDDARHVGELG